MEFQIYSYSQLDSTNRMAWEYCQQGAKEGTVIVAAEQTAGRGQWGRQWQSELGGGYLSVLLRPSLASQDAGQLTLCTAWGIAQHLQDLGIPVGLKWPNDLVLQGRKLGGILTETRVSHNRIDRSVVGIGLNVCNSVPPTGISLQSYLLTHKSGAELDPTSPFSCLTPSKTSDAAMDLSGVIQAILQGVNRGYSRWQQQGISGILADYKALLMYRRSAMFAEQPFTITSDQLIGDHPFDPSQVVQIMGVTPQGHLIAEGQNCQGQMQRQVLQPGDISLGYGS